MSPNVIFSFTFGGDGNTTTAGFQSSPFGPPPGFGPQPQFGQPFGSQQQFRPPPAPPKPAKPCAHRILGVACDITPTSLRTVYRKLAKANHPDIGPDAERDARTRRMALINAAYEEAKGQSHA